MPESILQQLNAEYKAHPEKFTPSMIERLNKVNDKAHPKGFVESVLSYVLLKDMSTDAPLPDIKETGGGLLGSVGKLYAAKANVDAVSGKANMEALSSVGKAITLPSVLLHSTIGATTGIEGESINKNIAKGTQLGDLIFDKNTKHGVLKTLADIAGDPLVYAGGFLAKTKKAGTLLEKVGQATEDVIGGIIKKPKITFEELKIAKQFETDVVTRTLGKRGLNKYLKMPVNERAKVFKEITGFDKPVEQTLEHLKVVKDIARSRKEASGIKKYLYKWLDTNIPKEMTKKIISQNKALQNRLEVNANTLSHEAKKWFDKQGKRFGVDFQMGIEEGKFTSPEAVNKYYGGILDEQTSKNLFEKANEYRTRLDNTFAQTFGKKSSKITLGEMANNYTKRLEKISLSNVTDKEKAESFIENYFAHIWEDPEKARHYFTSKLRTNASFMKKRSISLIREGIKEGKLKLKYTNPEEALVHREILGFQLKAEESILTSLKEKGVIKFFKYGKKVPDEYVHIGVDQLKRFIPIGKNQAVRGEYYATPGAAKVLKNYVSSGLYSRNDIIGKAFKGFVKTKNILLSSRLALSGFHLWETGRSMAATKLIQAEKDLGYALAGKGSYMAALKRLAEVPVSPFMAQGKGYSLIKAWKAGRPLSGDAALAQYQKDFIELSDRGGMRYDIAPQLYMGVDKKIQSLFRHMRRKEFGGAAKDFIPAGVEAISAPIMEKWVPHIKAYAYMERAADFIKRNPEMSRDMQDIFLRKISDNIDNAFGQINYDNLFWNRTAKDVAVGSQLSLGWTLGMWRAFGGAIDDAAKMIVGGATKGAEKVVSDRMLYAANYTALTMIEGAIITKMMTGKNSTELLDYIYPLNGKKDHLGNKDRFQTPSMVKDPFALYEQIRKQTDGSLLSVPFAVIKGVGGYARNKITPAFGLGWDIINNKDFYGTEIMTRGGDLLPNAKELAEYVMYNHLEPISVSDYLRKKKEGKLKKYSEVLSFVGATHAPQYIRNTKAQNDIFHEFNVLHGQREKTKLETAKYRLKLKESELIQKGDLATAEALHNELKKRGIWKRGFTKSFIEEHKMPSDLRLFKSFGAERQIRLMRRWDIETVKYYLPYANDEILKRFNLR